MGNNYSTEKEMMEMELLSEDAQARASSQDSEEDSLTEQLACTIYDATPPPPYPGPGSRTDYIPQLSHPVATQCTHHDTSHNEAINLPNAVLQDPQNSQFLLSDNPISLPSSNPHTEIEQQSPLSDELKTFRANASSEASIARGK